MTRKTISPTVQADLLLKARRRCALCVGIDGNDSERPGQIAHLNGDHSDNRLENLVWLCLEHHDKFDSKTSQTKNYTQIEVRNYRESLYARYASPNYDVDDISLVRNYLREYSELFAYMFRQYSELAYAIDSDVMNELGLIRDYWRTNGLRSFNSSIQEIQDHIANNDTANFSREELEEKRRLAKEYVDVIAGYYKRLEEIATN